MPLTSEPNHAICFSRAWRSRTRAPDVAGPEQPGPGLERRRSAWASASGRRCRRYDGLGRWRGRGDGRGWARPARRGCRSRRDGRPGCRSGRGPRRTRPRTAGRAAARTSSRRRRNSMSSPGEVGESDTRVTPGRALRLHLVRRVPGVDANLLSGAGTAGATAAALPVFSAGAPRRARQAADRRTSDVRRGRPPLRRHQRRAVDGPGPALAPRGDRGGRPAAGGAGPRPGRRHRYVEPALRRPRRDRRPVRLLARHAAGRQAAPSRTCRSRPATAPSCRSPTRPSTR